VDLLFLLGLWSINLDKNRESFEWSVYSTSVSIGYAISAAIGAIIAQFFGFVYTFTLVGILSIIGGLILFFLEKKSRQKNYFKKIHPDFVVSYLL